MRNESIATQKALNLWAVILIIWSFYRLKFQLPEWFDEFIAKPLVFVLPIYFYIKKVEKGNFFKNLDFHIFRPFSNYLIGVLIGLVFFATAIFGNFIKFNKFIFLPGKVITAQSIIVIFAIAFATSISEEILSRGFILKRLYHESRNLLTSSFFASFLFFFLHVPIIFTNNKLTGNLIIFIMVTDLLLSLVNSFLFIYKKNLVVPILVHAFYNLTIYLFAF